MAGLNRFELPEEAQSCSTVQLGEALAGWTLRSAAAECRWLGALVEFDHREGWYLDGQLSAGDWLVWRCGMSARTARDKLRVAHELCRRPLVAEAFAAGRLSYCQVRAITRVTRRWKDWGTVVHVNRPRRRSAGPIRWWSCCGRAGPKLRRRRRSATPCTWWPT